MIIKPTSRYLDDLLNIDNPYFKGMVNQIYPPHSPQLQFNKANTSDTEASFWIYIYLFLTVLFKCDDFDFDIAHYPFLDGDVRFRPSDGVYISQLIRFTLLCSHIEDFDARNKYLTAKLLKQDYRYHKLRKAFSKLYRRHH